MRVFQNMERLHTQMGTHTTCEGEQQGVSAINVPERTTEDTLPASDTDGKDADDDMWYHTNVVAQRDRRGSRDDLVINTMRKHDNVDTCYDVSGTLEQQRWTGAQSRTDDDAENDEKAWNETAAVLELLEMQRSTDPCLSFSMQDDLDEWYFAAALDELDVSRPADASDDVAEGYDTYEWYDKGLEQHALQQAPSEAPIQGGNEISPVRPLECDSRFDVTHEFTVRGVRVKMPFEPYDAQRVMLNNMFAALSKNENVMLEAPTGLGKTITLLGGSLAWCEHLEKERKQREREVYESKNSKNNASVSENHASLSENNESLSILTEQETIRSVANISTSLTDEEPVCLDNEFKHQGAESGDDDFMNVREMQEKSARLRACMQRSKERERGGRALTQTPTQRQRRSNAPTVIFATRTQGQVTQVVHELRKLHAYNPHLTVLGSRNHTCINDAIRNQADVDDACMKALIAPRDRRLRIPRCYYSYTGRVMRLAQADELEPITGQYAKHDLEDLAKVARDYQSCAYFAALERARLNTTELVVVPYNYVLSPLIRESVQLNLSNSILIIDEAHNVDQVCRDSVSFEITLAELRRIHVLVHYACLDAYVFRHANQYDEVNEVVNHMEVLERFVAHLCRCLELRTESLQAALARRQNVPQAEHRRLRGSELCAELSMFCLSEPKCNAVKGAMDVLHKFVDQAVKELRRLPVQDRAEYKQRRRQNQKHRQRHKQTQWQMQLNLPKQKRTQRVGTTIKQKEPPPDTQQNMFDMSVLVDTPNFHVLTFAVSNVLHVMRPVEKMIHVTDICVKTPKALHAFNLILSVSRHAQANSSVQLKHEMKLWCLDASITFTQIAAQTRCIVLASGTLSPLQSLQSELGVSFPIVARLGHVIDARAQLYCAIVGSVQYESLPTEYALSLGYEAAHDIAMQDKYAYALVRLLSCIPGGVLVFFPSFRVMSQLILRWRTTGMFEYMQHVKCGTIFIEGSSSELNRKKKSTWDSAIKSSGTDGDDAAQDGIWNSDSTCSTGQLDTVRQYRRITGQNELNTHNSGDAPSAILFAVYRGCSSEGIDFRDNQSRAVIALGIPYAPYGDLQVQCKREYNDCEGAKRSTLQSGADWYNAQAFQALNQAIGRCIRHRQDYGAIIFLDERLSTKTSKLSKWLPLHESNASSRNKSVTTACDELRRFFAKH